MNLFISLSFQPHIYPDILFFFFLHLVHPPFLSLFLYFSLILPSSFRDPSEQESNSALQVGITLSALSGKEGRLMEFSERLLNV